MGVIRLLFLADTHLGFDLPFSPRVERPRRGPDFFRNFRLALEPAMRGEVDGVIHGGDLLYRSRVPARLVDMALGPLKEVADLGVPVFLVPGNHERSCIPCGLLARHPGLHVFDRPRCFHLEVKGSRICMAGFPYVRGIRRRFPEKLETTGWRGLSRETDAVLLSLHHCFEGARVGPADHMFRGAADVIRHADVPAGITAVLSGHIHRAQVLTRDLNGRPLQAPILYPGSIERTSFAEMEERKGYVRVDLRPSAGPIPLIPAWSFHPLPVRPMRRVRISAAGLNASALEALIRRRLERIEPNAVVQLSVRGLLDSGAGVALRAASLRALAPADMPLSLRIEDGPKADPDRRRHSGSRKGPRSQGAVPEGGPNPEERNGRRS
jgi:DNA repair protein SbcD/Mre11